MKTVLIVEDNEEIREEICDIFRMENFGVLEATNGHDGYINAINNVPDLIITDILMPLLDGYRMYEKLKENPLTDTIPVIFLSALTSENDIRKGMNLGVDDYLTKPVIPDDLLLAANNKLKKYEKLDKKVENLKISITDKLQHELRTPLNAIVGFSGYLKDKVFELPNDEVIKIINQIYESGERLHVLVEKYLQYANLKMKSLQPSEVKNLRMCDYTDAAAVIQNAAKSLGDQYGRYEDFVIDTIFVEVRMNEGLLFCVISELIENALKFSEKGQLIKISSDVNNNRFKIRVKNEGIGMTTDQIKEIGDFKQFNKDKLAQNGSGLGLSIVKLIADIYNVDFNIISMYEQYLTATLIFRKAFRI